MTASFTSVVFDLGGVLIDWDPEYLYRKLIPNDEERHDFLTKVCTREWHNRHDKGVSFADNARELSEKYPNDPRLRSLIYAWGERYEEMFSGSIQGSVKILEELNDAKVALYALTNWSAEYYPKACKSFPFLFLFKDAVVSGEEHVMKPDPQIYEILLERTKIDPRRAIYIDDRKENLLPASALGFTTILFTTPEALRAELIRHRLPLAPMCGL
ncbi:MAG: HAD family phosphatase [Alphaproteobacteria bacterium]|nr:HAD family phosphatase [Alphaproteobacteria bacterium]